MNKMMEFDAVIQQAEGYSNGAFIYIPFEVEKVYDKKRVKVIATFDGHKYTGSLVRMGSPEHILIVRKDIREKINKSFGDKVKVTLLEDTTERKVTVPKDFEKLMKKVPEVHSFFKKLAFTHQKEYVQWIEEAKKPETRQRRMDKAIEMMQNGKKER